MSRVLVVVGLQAGLVLVFWAGQASADSQTTVQLSKRAHPLERLAAKELRRYIYATTGSLPILETIRQNEEATKKTVVVGDKDDAEMQALARKTGLEISSLGEEDFLIASLPTEEIFVVGGGPRGTLYGSYRLAEKFGVGFGLDRDSVPTSKPGFWPHVNLRATPRFSIRGLLPFHDFAEGPDLWNADEYGAFLHQLPKLGFNFFSLHTYPEEPTVWLGKAEDVKQDGEVTASYPAGTFTTSRRAWGYLPRRTSGYSFGTANLFERNDFGSEVMAGLDTKSVSDQHEIFRRTLGLMSDVFHEARALGLKSAMGVELPLQGNVEGSPEEIFSGSFARIMESHPLDYYWLWTKENWTWSGNTSAQADDMIKTVRAAHAVAKKLNTPFGLAISGWVLGPDSDRTLFDRALPPEIPLSALNRNVGFEGIDSAFRDAKLHPKWVIPWLEDDPALTTPELWSRRLIRDATEAQDAGVQGMIGCHWRTVPLGPVGLAFSRLTWSADFDLRSFYYEWAQTQFGSEPAKAIASIFSEIDSDLPRPAEWVNGPGGVLPQRGVQIRQATTFSPKKFSLVHNQEELGGHAVGQPIVAAEGDRLIVAMRGTDDRVHLREWNKNPLTPWYNLRGGATWGGLRFVSDSRGLALHRRAPDGKIYVSHRVSGTEAGAWSPWRRCEDCVLSAETAEPRTVEARFGSFEVSNPSIAEEYRFVDRLAALEPEIKGAAERARYRYWLEQFRYMRAIAELQEKARDFDEAMENHGPTEKLVRLRHEELGVLKRVYVHLLQTVESSGELGTIINWEQHILPTLIEAPGFKLEMLLGHPLTPDLRPAKNYDGPLRLIIPTVTSNLRTGEPMRVRALALGASAPVLKFHWRKLGAEKFNEVTIPHVSRGVYEWRGPTSGDDFEYYVSLESREGLRVFPESASEGRYQTVVVDL